MNLAISTMPLNTYEARSRYPYCGGSYHPWNQRHGYFVGYYWFILADLGQRSPVTYDGEYFLPLNFSRFNSHNETNNVILNSTLAELIYTNIGSNGTDMIASVLQAARLNRTVEPESRFRRIYHCQERRLKKPIPFLVSVGAQGVSLIALFNLLGIYLMSKVSGTIEGNQALWTESTDGGVSCCDSNLRSENNWKITVCVCVCMNVMDVCSGGINAAIL